MYNANIYETQTAFETPTEPHRLVQVLHGGQEVTVRGGICIDSITALMDATTELYCRAAYIQQLPNEFRQFNVENVKQSAENLR